MSKPYDSKKLESKWIEVWEKEKVYKSKSKIQNPKSKIYLLSMFPYPSGSGLHVGHVRIYTGTDVIARYFRMKGYEVLHPMGWDAFGLPAENAAVKAKKNPMDMVPKNIARFKQQMQQLGFSYDWDRELSTINPTYYQWTQWLFIQFFKMGLLYKQDTAVYYCPQCQTGLAEEEVLPNGTHERCGKPITRKKLPQWLFRITDYADSLLAGLEDLDWPKGILEMQKNWIGKKQGINITYGVTDSKSKTQGPIAKITCFTTRPETNFGATFVVVAPEHRFVQELIDSRFKIQDSRKKQIREYVEKAMAKTDLERLAEGKKKTGIFTGFYCVNKLNNKLMPIYVSDFVLVSVGTGAVVGVPGHDQRDFEFAKEFDLEIITVVQKPHSVLRQAQDFVTGEQKDVFEGEGININSGFLNGLETKPAIKKICDYLEQKGWGKRAVNYHLRDWIFSRQRYWGEPIPMVFCPNCAKQNKGYFDTDSSKKDLERYRKISYKLFENCSLRIENLKRSMSGWYPLDDSELPLKLPYLKEYEPTKTGQSPLIKSKQWLKTSCPECGKLAERESDTMPNWAGSCWYYLKFAEQTIGTKNEERRTKNSYGESWKLKIENSKYLPVDWYLGGAEHAVLHLLYARFWVHILNDLKLLGFREPFLKLRNVGMVLAEDHRKMSKSLGNVINPNDIREKFSSDALRIYEMFMAPFNLEIAWSSNTLQGAQRFLNKVYQLFQSSANIATTENEIDKKTIQKLQNTINKVEKDITNVKFNTAVASLMEFANHWQKSKLDLHNAKKYLIILAPFAPFMTEEIWQNILKENKSIHIAQWPTFERVKITDEKIVLPIQVNGKVRALIKVKSNKAKVKTEVIKLAVDNEKILKYLKNKKYKTIYVPGKILNFIIENES